MAVNGIALGCVAAGSLFVFAGLKGKSIPSTVQTVLLGKAPATADKANQIQGSSSNSKTGPGSKYVGGNPPDSASVSGYKAYAQALLVAHGWPGQFGSFNNIVMAESSWDPQATNPGSGAYGIAQALGHGNSNTAAPNGENNYGNYGTSDAVCRSANEGHGDAQIEWMMNYIASAYGSPDAAWAYHQANNAY